MLKRVPVTSESPHCSTCMMGNVCLPVGMSSVEVAQLDDLVKERLRIEKGQALFQHGTALDALFSLRTGSIRTQIVEASGHHQITGFFLPGEIVGLDGMMDGIHSSTAFAMEDSEVCIIKLDDIDKISPPCPLTATSNSSPDEQRNCQIPSGLARFRLDALGATSGRFSDQFIATLSRAGLFINRIQYANESRRDRKLSRPYSGNSEPAVFTVCQRGCPARQPA